MSVIAHQRFIAFNINAKPRKMWLITDDLFLESNHLNPDENIVIVSRIESLEKLLLKKTSFFEIDYKLLVQLDPNTFETCILFITNFPFPDVSLIEKLKQNENQIQIVSEINTTESFIEQLHFCVKNGLRLIIDVSEFTNVNWDNYKIESGGIGILYNSNFNPSSRNATLQDLRAKIEACDKLIYEQFAKRMTLIEEIAQLKKSECSEAYQPSKFIENILSLNNNKNINEENKMDVIKLYQTLHDIAVDRQKKSI